MLQRLLISHYALLDHLEMDLNPGLTTVTGETGAGKSILLGAIGLILGQRADTSVVSEGHDKCIIEGYFDLSKLDLEAYFEANDLDYSPVCIFRREISKLGKSRAFINDTPVTLPVLKELGAYLVEIQTQHTNLMMRQSEVQREMLDSFHSETPILSNYSEAYEKSQQIQRELHKAENALRNALKERDFNLFQLNEIEILQLKEDEEISLEQEIKELSQADEIKTQFNLVAEGLSEGELNARSLIAQLYQAIKGFDSINTEFSDFKQRLKSVSIEIDDLANEANRIAEKTDQNPERLFDINDRFEKIQHLFRKHQVHTCKELLEIAASLSVYVSSTEELENQIEHLKSEQNTYQTQCIEWAKLLHEQRKEAGLYMAEKSVLILKRLNMIYSQVVFDIDFNLDYLGPFGADQITLLFTANPGTPPQPAGEIASGGELSRLNFAFRSIISEKKLLPTLIYDEADTGISGEVAAKMGQLFRELGQRHQIICITHLPQVAAAGNFQWEVIKRQDANSSRSEVNKLNSTERVTSIAKMLSGSEMTDAAISHARHLLEGN